MAVRCQLIVCRIQTVVITVGPIVVPRLIAFYRSIKNPPKNSANPIRPVPRKTALALNILFFSAVIALVYTLNYFAPENVFKTTQSRLQIPTDTLFARLAHVRELTDDDEVLRSKFNSLEFRLLYLRYGPDVMISCPFCSNAEPTSYLYYYFPRLAAPHISNLAVLGLVTSAPFAGAEGGRWRTQVIVAGCVLAALDLWVVSSYNYKLNATKAKLEWLDMFYWNMRVYRGIAIAAVQGVFGWVLYLTSTNRWLAKPPSVSERIESSTRILTDVHNKIAALGVLRNTIYRDSVLREAHAEYWMREQNIMSEVMAERDVNEGVTSALTRLDIDAITTKADEISDGALDMAGLKEVEE